MSGRVRSLAERHDALKRDADARVSGPPAPFDQCCFDQTGSARRLSRAADGVRAAGAALESRRLEEVDRREGAEARAARLEAQLREVRAPASCVRTKSPPPPCALWPPPGRRLKRARRRPPPSSGVGARAPHGERATRRAEGARPARRARAWPCRRLAVCPARIFPRRARAVGVAERRPWRGQAARELTTELEALMKTLEDQQARPEALQTRDVSKPC